MSCTIATEGGPVDREVARKKKSHIGIFSIRGFKGDPRQVCLVLWIWQAERNAYTIYGTVFP